MIDCKIENFTAIGAVEAGLIEAVKRGETIIEGHYEISTDGLIEFKQRNFAFTDKNGKLRVGKFFDKNQIMKFSTLFKEAGYTE